MMLSVDDSRRILGQFSQKVRLEVEDAGRVVQAIAVVAYDKVANKVQKMPPSLGEAVNIFEKKLNDFLKTLEEEAKL